MEEAEPGTSGSTWERGLTRLQSRKNGTTAASSGKTCAAERQAQHRKLRPGDKAALQAGNMTKEIEAAVGRKMYVLNPPRLVVICRLMKKTDKEDALKLAHLLGDFREERLPTAVVPSDKEMLSLSTIHALPVVNNLLLHPKPRFLYAPQKVGYPRNANCFRADFFDLLQFWLVKNSRPRAIFVKGIAIHPHWGNRLLRNVHDILQNENAVGI